jgi:hypothetical protein
MTMTELWKAECDRLRAKFKGRPRQLELVSVYALGRGSAPRAQPCQILIAFGHLRNLHSIQQRASGDNSNLMTKRPD